MRKYQTRFLNYIIQSILPNFIKQKVALIFGHRLSVLYPKCYVGEGEGHLLMGDHSFCNVGCYFDLGSDITIGKNVAVGMNVHFITTSHEMGGASRRAGFVIRKPIYIEDGCWIGADTIILPGVRIGKGCVVGAGSLVTKDLQQNSLCVGRPAVLVKEL